MRDHPVSEAPNYKNACVVMFGVNITWIFAAIWAIWGLIFVILLGAAINHLMTRLQARAEGRARAQRCHPVAHPRY